MCCTVTPLDYLAQWHLIPDGDPIITPTSIVLPVRQRGLPAMLKIAAEDEERRGMDTMVWWNGDGAARVLAHDGQALLLERALGEASLADMARTGRDDEATRIICAATLRLHTQRDQPHPPSLVPLSHWFAALEPGADRHGDILHRAAATARELLAAPRNSVVLHGDIHHGNMLDFGARGWLAIDPKGLLGERDFDFVNILRNPDETTALTPGLFSRQATVITEAAGLDRVRLLQWTLAFAGLSAAWIFEDGDEPALDLAIAALAVAEIDKASGEATRRQAINS
ncbi:MAG: 3'-kinase [Chloroflexia bacterium]|nr:3'-kinase [Chloroflexia bacterium]